MKAPAGRISPATLEALGLAACLLLVALLLGNRVRSEPLPGGDEGSWLAVAAQLAAGEGLTTRWLEYHYLEPYALPRPDDMRFPALVAVLAAGMKVLGPSLLAMRSLMAAVYLAFLVAAWAAVRARWGPLCAFLTAWLMALSPLQHEWGSLVYCEGLFGLVLSLWLLWILKVPRERPAHALGSGALIGLLCLVRPNAALLAPAAALAAWLAARRPAAPVSPEGAPARPRRAWVPPLLVLAACLLALAPWLLRNQIHFGEAFHVGGSAGLLRDSHRETATLGAGEFLARYGVLFPARRVLEGFPRFFASLHHFEKGLEVLPLILALAALLRRRAFLAPAAALGFALSFAACLYASYNSWAGLRYFSPFLPFVYAYGLSQAASLRFRIPPRARPFAVAGFALLLALPVVNPHRFWLRDYPARETATAAGLPGYLEALARAVPPGGAYLAASLCQVNYLRLGHCVGLQGPGRDQWLPRALLAFRPTHLAFTHAELAATEGDAPGAAVLEELTRFGWRAGVDYQGPLGVIFRIRPPGTSGP